MDRSTIIELLQEHEAELKAAGIEHLALHGSYAHGTATGDESDVMSSRISTAARDFR